MTKKHVRPLMTTEARDTLNDIHELMNGKDRSHSLELFWQEHGALTVRHLDALYELSDTKQFLNKAYEEVANAELERNEHKYELTMTKVKLQDSKFLSHSLGFLLLISVILNMVMA